MTWTVAGTGATAGSGLVAFYVAIVLVMVVMLFITVPVVPVILRLPVPFHFALFFPLLVGIFALFFPHAVIFLPLPVRNMPLLDIPGPIVARHVDQGTGNARRFDDDPTVVIMPRVIPSVAARRPPVPVVEEDVYTRLRHEINTGLRHHDQGRRFGHNDRRRADVYVYADRNRRQRISGEQSPKHGQKKQQGDYRFLHFPSFLLLQNLTENLTLLKIALESKFQAYPDSDLQNSCRR